MQTGVKQSLGSSADLVRPPDKVVFGVSPAMAEVRTIVEKAAHTNVPVLLVGENGTGKDVLAQIFHENSNVRRSNFVKVHCPAIPGGLLESELFGYERGAFTGAFAVKAGRVEQAHEGTLFLDEISEINVELQAKLLQLLQDGSYMRIGGQEPRHANVRMVCASNRDFAAEIAAGNFRQDLYYRIAVISVRVPPLRERLADIPVIADYFLAAYSEKYSAKNVKPLSAAVEAQMMKHRWPGNIRELQNIVRRYVILGTEDCIVNELTGPDDSGVTLDIDFDGQVPLHKVTREAIRKLEAKLILKVLRKNEWNRRKTARDLKISYRALLYKIRDAGVPFRHTRKEDPVVALPDVLPTEQGLD